MSSGKVGLLDPDACAARDAIMEECDEIKAMLVAKNAAYGNSAFDPIRIFSRTDAEEQIRVRIDDKISRLKRGSAAGEDTEMDLLGYLVLLRAFRRLRAASTGRVQAATTAASIATVAARKKSSRPRRSRK